MNRQQRRAAGRSRTSAPGTAQSDADALLQAFARNDAVAAERLARAALRRHPDHPIALHVLSVLLLAKGASDEAAVIAERALAALHAPPELLALAARAHAINGDLVRAVARFEQAAVALPNDATVQQQLTLARTELREIETTRAALHGAAHQQRDDADLLAPVAQRFDRTIAGIGVSPAGILHDDPDLHRRTFDVLLDVVDTTEHDDLFVQDLGCGYGALFDVLRTHSWFARGRYRGLDVSAQMVESARAHVVDPRAQFAQGSELGETSDIVIVAGTWNFKLNASDAAWTAYIRKSLANVAAHARLGFAFNLLHRGQAESPHLFSTTPGPWLAACDEFGFSAVLRDDYSPREFAILARRKEATRAV
jgi:tetratricopeptide (TPR) repeat protein